MSFVLFYFVIDCFDFLMNKFLISFNGLTDGKVVLFTKNENDPLVQFS